MLSCIGKNAGQVVHGRLSGPMAPHRWPRSGEGFSHFFHNCWAHAPMAHTNAPRALRAFGASGARGRVSCGKVRKVLPGRPRLRLRASHRPVVAGSRVEGWSGRGVLGPKSWQNFPSGAQSAHWDRGDLCGATGSYPIHWSELRSKNEQACSISKMADFRDG